jgi:8-oxo-dGTP pyrophosphatase MutT (NUDIX family)
MPEPRYLKKLPESARILGDANAGEIEIISKSEAPKIREKTGIIFEDSLHFFVRDAVKFKNGESRTQMRLIGCTMFDGPSGVVALPSRNGKIVLREMFRHATRQWGLEAPRGQRETGYTAEAAIRKELDEELGFPVRSLERIGEVSGDSAILASSLPVFWAELGDGPPRDHPEGSEALGKIVELTPEELKNRIVRGDIRDGYTLAAMTLARIAGRLEL